MDSGSNMASGASGQGGGGGAPAPPPGDRAAAAVDLFGAGAPTPTQPSPSPTSAMQAVSPISLTPAGPWSATAGTATPGATSARRSLFPPGPSTSPKVRRPNPKPQPQPPADAGRVLSNEDLTAGFSSLSTKWDQADMWLQGLAEVVTGNANALEFEQKKRS